VFANITVCSNHYGGLGGGHYTAYALNDDGVWCYYDDSRISENADPKDVVSEAAYVVYFRRKDVDVSDDFPRGLATPTIVTDNMDNNISTVRRPSETSSTNAATAEDMDVDLLEPHNTTDAESHASSKTSTSPMDSNEGGGSNLYGDDDVDEANNGLHYDPASENTVQFPLQ